MSDTHLCHGLHDDWLGGGHPVGAEVKGIVLQVVAQGATANTVGGFQYKDLK